MGRMKIKTKNIVKQIEKKSTKKKKSKKSLSLIPTPSTLFNLACSDEVEGGLEIGRMVNIIGDSSSGKSLFSLSILAEMSLYSKFDDYRFIYDDTEHAYGFDTEALFGEFLAERIEAPSKDEDNKDVFSNTIEDFHCHICDAIDEGKPFIYILDSFDSLDSVDDIKKVEEMRKARAKGIQEKGSYNMSKAKKSSQLLRNIVGKLKKTNSLLIIISQTRDNIDPFSFERKTRSGGNALRFYATHEVWLANAGKIPKTVLGESYTIGHKVKVKISKNKITGKKRIIEFSIYEDYGIDDIQSCIDFLLKRKHWNKSGRSIKADELGLKATPEKLIEIIEKDELEDKLKRIVKKVWAEIEEKLVRERKPKYRKRIN